jgi:poly(3-hydroxyalkanoate) synthetase
VVFGRTRGGRALHYPKLPLSSATYVAHITLLATLVECSQSGGIDVFIDEDALDALDELMAHHGYLDSSDMHPHQ